MDQDLIRRYLRNECTPEERKQVKALMKSGGAKPLFDEVLNEHWNTDADADNVPQLSTWKDKFAKRIKDHDAQFTSPRRNYSWLKYAAVLAIIISIAGGYALLNLSTHKPDVIAMQESINPNGKLLRIKLSDSSIITLNAASKLRYPASFKGKTREIYLEGEAFFDIVHDPAHPFIVHTSKLKVSVLGTSFNIKAYATDKKISVDVATGKVGVLTYEKGSKPFMLLPGDQIAFNAMGKDPVESKVALDEIAAWQSGIFVYHNEPLGNIAKQLERRYDVKILFKKESLRHLRFNLKQKNDRLENVMKTLKFAGGINYEISGNTVTIS